MNRRDWIRYCGLGGILVQRLSGQGALLSQGALLGAGATFPAPLYEKWFGSFAKHFPGESVRYSAVGSGEGVSLLQRGETDFAASDHPLDAKEAAKLLVPIQHVPTVVGGIVPIYNLEGVTQPLQFTAEILAAIYLGKIVRWNDPALRAVNRGVALPGQEIRMVHRADPSGTTFIWSEYLSGVSEEWARSVGQGEQVKWPKPGMAAKGSSGVVEAVAATSNALGCVEFIYALDHRLGVGVVKNRAGKFVRADLTSLAAAAATASAEDLEALGDSHLKISNAAGNEAYPIAAFTYLLVPKKLADNAKDATLRRLLKWILSSGQLQCAALGYAALPAKIAARVLQQANLD